MPRQTHAGDASGVGPGCIQSEQPYYRWKQKFGGLRIDQAKRLKDLEKENSRRKQLVADAELDKANSSRGCIGTPLGGAAHPLGLFTVA